MDKHIFPYDELKYFGIDIKNLDNTTRQQLEKGQVTELIHMKVPYSFEMETYLNKKDIAYKIQSNEILFDGRIQLKPEIKIDNTKENKELLKINNIRDFKSDKKKLTLTMSDIQHVNSLLLTTLNPIVSLALFIIFKQLQPKLEGKDLSKEEINKLKNGDVIKHNFGKGDIVLQVDPKTNSLVSIPINALNIPQQVLNIDLTPIQKEQLRNAQSIELTTEKGKKVFITLDLTKSTGLIIRDEAKKEINIQPQINTEMQNRFLYDLYDDSIMDTIATDENRNKYIEYVKQHVQKVQVEGAIAIENIHPTDTLKQMSLVKYLGAETEYKKYNDLLKELKTEDNPIRKNNIEYELNRTDNAIKSKASNKLDSILQINMAKSETISI